MSTWRIVGAGAVMGGGRTACVPTLERSTEASSRSRDMASGRAGRPRRALLLGRALREQRLEVRPHDFVPGTQREGRAVVRGGARRAVLPERARVPAVDERLEVGG